MSLKMFDAELRSMSEDIILPDNFTTVRKFEINVPINFILECGPRTKNFRFVPVASSRNAHPEFYSLAAHLTRSRMST